MSIGLKFSTPSTSRKKRVPWSSKSIIADRTGGASGTKYHHRELKFSSDRACGKPLDDEVKSGIDQGVRRAAYRIIQGKKATYYGIGAGLSRLARAVRDDERGVFTISVHEPDIVKYGGISLSLPRVLGRTGVVATLRPSLSAAEEEALLSSAGTLQEAWKKIPLPENSSSGP